LGGGGYSGGGGCDGGWVNGSVVVLPGAGVVFTIASRLSPIFARSYS